MYKIYQRKIPVTEVILHCAAIRTGQFAGLSAYAVRTQIDRWHQERGFTGFGYHGLIMPDGEFLAGRPFSREGAHCQGRNFGTIGFLLIESIQIRHVATFTEWFKPEQMDSLRDQIARLRLLGVTKVSGHNDYAPKLCPGFRARDYFK